MQKILSIVGVVLVGLVTVSVILGLILNALAKEVSPPGQMIDVGGYKLHFNCAGPENDLPPIIVESGQATPTPVYHWLQKNLSVTGKVYRKLH